MPQHVVLLPKIELGSVWPHIKFVYSFIEKHNTISYIRIKIRMFMLDWINTAVRDKWQGHMKTAVDCGSA